MATFHPNKSFVHGKETLSQIDVNTCGPAGFLSLLSEWMSVAHLLKNRFSKLLSILGLPYAWLECCGLGPYHMALALNVISKGKLVLYVKEKTTPADIKHVLDQRPRRRLIFSWQANLEAKSIYDSKVPAKKDGHYGIVFGINTATGMLYFTDVARKAYGKLSVPFAFLYANNRFSDTEIVPDFDNPLKFVEVNTVQLIIFIAREDEEWPTHMGAYRADREFWKKGKPFPLKRKFWDRSWQPKKVKKPKVNARSRVG